MTHQSNMQQHLKMSSALFHATVSILVLLLVLLISPGTTKAAITRPTNSYLSQVNQFLAPHNAVRRPLRMVPLVWDEKVARYAKRYANQRRFDCALRHSNGPYGENIFWGSGDSWTPGQAVMAWISEKKWYNYWSNSCSGREECGHYTQIVWRKTRRVGCARVTCFGGRGTFMICNYDPPGNFVGERPY